MKAKNVYELRFKTTSLGWLSLLYGSKKRAEKDLKERYSEGSIWAGKDKIINSYINERILF